jgi:hypothetical protein
MAPIPSHCFRTISSPVKVILLANNEIQNKMVKGFRNENKNNLRVFPKTRRAATLGKSP